MRADPGNFDATANSSGQAPGHLKLKRTAHKHMSFTQSTPKVRNVLKVQLYTISRATQSFPLQQKKDWQIRHQPTIDESIALPKRFCYERCWFIFRFIKHS